MLYQGVYQQVFDVFVEAPEFSDQYWLRLFRFLKTRRSVNNGCLWSDWEFCILHFSTI